MFQYYKNEKMVNHTIVLKGAVANLDTGEEYVIFNHNGKTIKSTYEDFKNGKFLSFATKPMLKEYSIPAYKVFN